MMTIPISQMRKPRHREGAESTQDCTARKWKSQDLNLDPLQQSMCSHPNSALITPSQNIAAPNREGIYKCPAGTVTGTHLNLITTLSSPHLTEEETEA